MDDSTVADAEKATASWAQDPSRANEFDLVQEKLFLSSKGRYWLECRSLLGEPQAKYLIPKESAQWLLVNGHALPADLKEFEGLVE